MIWIPPQTSFHAILGEVIPLTAQSPDQEFETGLLQEQPAAHTLHSIRDTTRPPFRWICRLAITFKEENGFGRYFGKGTGMLISTRHVLTAAHALDFVISGTDGKEKRVKAKSIRVVPGLNRSARGGQRRPFGSARMVASHYPSAFAAGLRSGIYRPDFDYGLIKLNTPLEAGHWGGSNWRINPVSKKSLDRKIVNIAGYPAEKRGTPWIAHGPVQLDALDDEVINMALGKTLSLDPADKRTITYLAQTLQGQSGGPVWRKRTVKDKAIRNLVAVHTNSLAASNSSTTRPVGIAVVLTQKVFDDIQLWQRSR